MIVKLRQFKLRRSQKSPDQTIPNDRLQTPPSDWNLQTHLLSYFPLKSNP